MRVSTERLRTGSFSQLRDLTPCRSWEKLLAVLRNGTLTFYKDSRHRDERQPIRGEAPFQLAGCSISQSDYSKKRNVLSLRLPVGAEFLLQTAGEVSSSRRDKDVLQEDEQRWLYELQVATGQREAEMSRSSTLPEGVRQKKGSGGGFFGRGKK